MNVTSRYKEATTNVDGGVVITAYRAPTYAVKYTTYRAGDLDSFESIAAWSLGDPQRWWEVADMNTHVKYPNYIPAGTMIRVPAL